MNTENKLTIEHLAPYLPYELLCTHNKGAFTNHPLDAISYSCETAWFDFETGTDDYMLNEFKPILRPMSDLYNTTGFSVSDLITHGYHNQFWSKEKFSIKHIYYHDLLILLKHHFDVFGLFEKGLAIDINTIEKK